MTEVKVLVTDALRRAFSLGQTYWQQADSEYTSHHRKADATRAKFQELCERTEETIDTLRGIKPEAPPRPPDGNGLPRYGLRWNGPGEPVSVPMDDGYWTPWHLTEMLRAQLAEAREIEELRMDADRYDWLFGPRTDSQISNEVYTVFNPLPQDVVISQIQGFYMSKSDVNSLIDAARKQVDT